MRKLTLGALVLVGWLATALAVPSADVGAPISALTTTQQAQAAIGRGGGGEGEGGGTQVGKRAASWLSGEVIAPFLIVVGLAVGAMAMQRNAGAAVAILVAAVVVGAFLLVPDKVEAWFRQIYNLIL